MLPHSIDMFELLLHLDAKDHLELVVVVVPSHQSLLVLHPLCNATSMPHLPCYYPVHQLVEDPDISFP